MLLDGAGGGGDGVGVTQAVPGTQYHDACVVYGIADLGARNGLAHQHSDRNGCGGGGGGLDIVCSLPYRALHSQSQSKQFFNVTAKHCHQQHDRQRWQLGGGGHRSENYKF